MAVANDHYNVSHYLQFIGEGGMYVSAHILGSVGAYAGPQIVDM